MVVTAIEPISQGLNKGRIFWKRRVKEIYGDLVSGAALDGVLPGPYRNLLSFQHEGGSPFERLQYVLRAPGGRSFRLITMSVEVLFKVSLAVQQRDSRH